MLVPYFSIVYSFLFLKFLVLCALPKPLAKTNKTQYRIEF